jgi:hypothetical protein
MDVPAIRPPCISADDVIEYLAGEEHDHATFICLRCAHLSGTKEWKVTLYAGLPLAFLKRGKEYQVRSKAVEHI